MFFSLTKLVNTGVFLFVFCFISINSLAQSSASVLTHDDYYGNPGSYVSTVNPADVTTGFLIDKFLFDSLLLNVGGVSSVTTITPTQWSESYDQLQRSQYTPTLPTIDTITSVNRLIHRDAYAYPINILNIRYNRIALSALQYSQFIESDDFLTDASASTASFTTEQALMASTIDETIYGNSIRFYIGSMFYFKNVSETLTQVQVDFDDGLGFVTVNWNDYRTVYYSSATEYHEIVVKLKFNPSPPTQYRYAHFTVLRIGSGTVPVPDDISASVSNPSGRTAPPPDRAAYYPVPSYNYDDICFAPNFCIPIYGMVQLWIDFPRIEYHILYSSANTAKQKLRRPLIVTDGFDPGNKRDYYTNHIARQELHHGNDFRGLFELMNGDPSPWNYVNFSSPDLVQSLLDRGYDIVFVNFTSGDGDIITNANLFGMFLTNVINSSDFRDELTEEAIVIGPSMGGVITRYALASMEKAITPSEHFVKAWFSFDAPHKGAYIPIGAQHVLGYLHGLSDLAHQGVKSLSSPAALQLLLLHHTATTSVGNPHEDFTDFYLALDSKGYPERLKRYAISNGGPENQYTLNNPSEILSYRKKYTNIKARAWGNQNADGDNAIMDSHRPNDASPHYFSTDSQIAYESAPGGWNSSALYPFNYKSDNAWYSNSDEYPFRARAAFIITSSAFGVAVTRETVNDNWTQYAVSDTQFDEIKGMASNEEHVTISPSTANYFLEELDEMFENSTIPFARTGPAINHVVKGKVAYTGKEILTFGDNGNTFIAETTSTIRVNAGEKIVLKPGFHAKPGSSFMAKIKTINTYELNTGRKALTSRISVDYTKSSPYEKRRYNYDNPEEIAKEAASLFLYPNPTSDVISVKMPAHSGPIETVGIYNALGQKMDVDYQIEGNHIYINVSSLSSGVFVVKTSDSFFGRLSARFIRK